MFTFNGIGTRIYGKRDLNPADNSYIATKWFTLLYFPVIPLGSYRVIKAKQESFFAVQKYQMTKVALNVKQVIVTYLAWWAIPVLLIGWALIADSVLKPH